MTTEKLLVVTRTFGAAAAVFDAAVAAVFDAAVAAEPHTYLNTDFFHVRFRHYRRVIQPCVVLYRNFK